MSKILRSEGSLNSHISFVKHVCSRADLNQVNSLTGSLPLRIGILQYMESNSFNTSNQLSYLTFNKDPSILHQHLNKVAQEIKRGNKCQMCTNRVTLNKTESREEMK